MRDEIAGFGASRFTGQRLGVQAALDCRQPSSGLLSLLLIIAIVSTVIDSHAQDQVLPSVNETGAHPAVPMAWATIRPLVYQSRDGELSGFMPELTRQLGAQIGFEPEFFQVESYAEWGKNQRSGGSAILPGVVKLPPLRESNRFSDPVFFSEVRLAVRIDDAERIDGTDVAGLRIGTLPPGAGSNVDLFPGASIVEYATTDAGLMGLLSGDVDALSADTFLIFSAAKTAGLDNRIGFVGDVLERGGRYIALHESRAELLQPINAELAKMEADGSLQALREKYSLVLPASEPDLLTVGVLHSPPYQTVEADGSFGGFAVQTLRNLAELAGLQLRFVEIDDAQWQLGPGPDRYDLLAHLEDTAERRERMDFTLPVGRESYSIFMLEREAGDVDKLTDLAGLDTGIALNRAVQTGRARLDGLQLTVLDSDTALTDSLLAGDIDAILAPSLQSSGDSLANGNRLLEVVPDVMVSSTSPALRFGLGQARERLNLVIPSYLVSARHQALIEESFGGPPEFWTDQRIKWLLLFGSLAFLALISGFALLLFMRRRAATFERRRFAAELVDQIPMGMVLVSPAGNIEFANAQAAHMDPLERGGLAVGASYREAIGAMADSGYFLNDEAHIEQALQQIVEPAGQANDVTELRLANGKELLHSSKRLSNDSTLITQLDVTEQRQRMRQIENLNQRLAHQVTVATAANDELRAFAYATSHDLKAPTNTSALLIDALEEELNGAAGGDAREFLVDLKQTNRRMAVLIDDVLDYTNAIGSKIVRSTVDLNQVTGNVLEALRSEIEASGAEITVGQLPVFAAQASQMHQLLQNLISNSIKFSHSGVAPKIRIDSCAAHSGHIAFSVQDNGIGMSDEQIDGIFGLFTRLNDQDDYPGTGLGLSICQRIALNHGGKIRVESALGRGTCFTVTLLEGEDDHQPDAGR